MEATETRFWRVDRVILLMHEPTAGKQEIGK